jgi:hypothetical protein
MNSTDMNFLRLYFGYLQEEVKKREGFVLEKEVNGLINDHRIIFALYCESLPIASLLMWIKL